MTIPIGYQLAKSYESGELFGWAGRDNPKLVKSAFDLLAGEFRRFAISGQTLATENRKTFLTDVVKLVTGGNFVDTQLTGDCVSFGGKHATEIVTCTQIAGMAVSQSEVSIGDFIAAARIRFRRIFAPYYYGTGRVYEGGGRLGNQAGSLGSWMYAAAKKYGALFEDENGVPRYSKQIADDWGNNRSTLDNWRPTASAYPIKSGAPIRTWSELCGATHNGYATTTASSLGYSMEPSSDGFHRQTTRWDHQMCFVGVDETYREQYALLMNQWGDVHGRLKDFQTGEALPPCILRIRRSDAEKHLNQGECYAYSSFQGFPEQRLDKALFMLL